MSSCTRTSPGLVHHTYTHTHTSYILHTVHTSTTIGIQALLETLGDMYVVCPSVSCPSQIGWPIRRKRQMTILVLKDWLYPQLRSVGMADHCNPHDVARLVDLPATLDRLSRRPCHLSWRDFCVASIHTHCISQSIHTYIHTILGITSGCRSRTCRGCTSSIRSPALGCDRRWSDPRHRQEW